MNYKLNLDENQQEKTSFFKLAKMLYLYIKGSRIQILIAFVFLLINSASVVVAPFIIGDVTNKYLPVGDKDNLLRSVLILGAIYIVGTIASYYQILTMGRVGQAILFRVRNAIFHKVQSLPLQFFNLNKSGDLISRINNDTEKLNQAFSETILRFAGNVVVIIGIGIVMVILNPTLGLIAWGSLLSMLVLTGLLSAWIRGRNNSSLQKLGELSAEIQESLSNFKVTIVFNRRNYFKDSFAKANISNQGAATMAGIANNVLTPIYTYAGTIGSMLILVAGIQLLILDKVSVGSIPEIGTLITFILYSSSFFNPLRELGELFSQIQTALASWARINKLLRLENNLEQIETSESKYPDALVHFDNVSFGYSKDTMVLKDINLDLNAGKTYALVGPTGGGKSTTASLMARLYDASAGKIFFKGRDIRSYAPDELANDIGFILQEPFLFSGSLYENIKYGNSELEKLDEDGLLEKLTAMKLGNLLARFGDGLKTIINPGAENISLGQRQLIAFVRALLRSPKLLILDEATANIDTVTEQLLEDILQKLPAETTKVIIAHRLNTIENADQIFFISGGTVEEPIDFKSALNLLNTSGNSKS